MTKRRTSIDRWLLQRFANEQIGWDELWLTMCALTGLRSRCVRARIGAVLVSADNVLLGLGYNGPPRGYATGPGNCDAWCPRATVDDTARDPYYHDCVTIHAEMNCLLRTSRPTPPGATLYVNGSVCGNCALFIANSGVARVIMRVQTTDQHRDPLGVADLLMSCGVETAIIRGNMSTMGTGSVIYRQIFVAEYGIGPHTCWHCDGVMPLLEVIHHVDEDHANNDPTNLVPVHAACHTIIHSTGVKQDPQTITKVHGPLVRCPTCGIESTRAGMGRHRKARDH